MDEKSSCNVPTNTPDPDLIERIAIDFKDEFVKQYEELKQLAKGEVSKPGHISGMASLPLAVGGIPDLLGKAVEKSVAYLHTKFKQNEAKLITSYIVAPYNRKQFLIIIVRVGAKFALAYETAFKNMIQSEVNRESICKDAVYRYFKYILKIVKENRRDIPTLDLTENNILLGIIKGNSKESIFKRFLFVGSKIGCPSVVLEDRTDHRTSQFFKTVNRRSFEFEELTSNDTTWWTDHENLINQIEERIFVEHRPDETKPIETRIDYSAFRSEMVPTSNNFYGREKQLQHLGNLFRDETKFLVTIFGLGGVGKSELATKFVNTCMFQKSGKCIWLNGDGAESLSASVQTFAQILRIPTQENDVRRLTVDIFNDGFAMIQTQEARVLVVIDNVDETDEVVKLLVIQIKKRRGFVILTSRKGGVFDYAGDSIDLDVLENDEAQELVCKSLPEESENDIQELCKKLQNFPLALQQAIAFMKTENGRKYGGDFKIRNYLDIYEGQQKHHLLGFPLIKLDHDYKDTTLVTWNVSIEAIKMTETAGEVAIEILNILACFKPKGIPGDLVRHVSSQLPHLGPNIISVFEDALELIKAYSLIKVQGNTISIHRLVQEVIRLNLIALQSDVEILRGSMEAFTNMKDTVNPCDMPHIISIWNHASKNATLVKEFYRFPLQVLKNLRKLSMYRKMLSFAITNHQVLKDILGQNDLETLKLEAEVAHALNLNGKYEDALETYKLILEKQKLILGQEDKETLKTSQGLANVLSNLGRHAEAREFYDNVQKLRMKVEGDSQREAIITKHNAAVALSKQGKSAEAMEIYDQVMDFQKTEFGLEDPCSLTMRRNIASSRWKQEDFERTKDILQQVLAINVKVQEKRHSETHTTED